MRSIYRNIIVLFLALSAAVSCSKVENVEFLTLECTSWMFSKGDDSVVVKVNSSSPDWEFSSSKDWIKVNRVGDDSIKIIVTANEDKDVRSGSVTVTVESVSADFKVEQFGNTYNGVFVDLIKNWSYAISRNGRYVATTLKDAENQWPVLIDIFTGEQKEFKDVTGFESVCAVSNEGVIFLRSTSMKAGIVKDGQFSEIPVPEGYEYPTVECVSADGTIWGGYVTRKGERGKKPAKWVNGVMELLESPEYAVDGRESYGGAMIRGCSDDGSVMYGSEWSGNRHPLAYWKDGKLYYPGYEFMEKKIVEDPYGDYEDYCVMVMDASNTNISPDGRYITSFYYEVTDSGYDTYAAIFDTETYKQIVLDPGVTGQTSSTGMSVTDGGLVFGATPARGVQEGYVYDLNDMSTTRLDEWFLENTGMHISSDRMVLYASADMNIFFGIRYINMGLGTVYKPWYFILDKDKLNF